MASVYSSLVHRLRVSFHSIMNSAIRNEYEQLSSELPAFFQCHSRQTSGFESRSDRKLVCRFVVQSTLTVNDDFMCISRLYFQPLEEVLIVFSS